MVRRACVRIPRAVQERQRSGAGCGVIDVSCRMQCDGEYLHGLPLARLVGGRSWKSLQMRSECDNIQCHVRHVSTRFRIGRQHDGSKWQSGRMRERQRHRTEYEVHDGGGVRDGVNQYDV